MKMESLFLSFFVANKKGPSELGLGRERRRRFRPRRSRGARYRRCAAGLKKEPAHTRSSLPHPHPRPAPAHMPGGCSLRIIARNLKTARPSLFNGKDRRIDLHLNVLRKRPEQFEQGEIRPCLYTQENIETPAAPAFSQERCVSF